ncbi:MAG: diaminopimelate epimerase [Ginsengibacter sp.]
MLEKIIFTKMHGIGNDYIYIDCTDREIKDPEKLSPILSNRNLSIGGDGIILIMKSDIADFRMRMFNADGSEGNMCGNGVRCIGKFVYDKKLTDKNTITLETKAGIKLLALNIENGKVKTVKVDMGEPILESQKIPVKSNLNEIINQNLFPDIFNQPVTCVSMGNPHAVFFVDKITTELVHTIGPIIEKHEIFPERINTEFVKVINRTQLEMRVWERGSGETLACGTGACAVTVAAILNNFSERAIIVSLLGGDLKIIWDTNNHVYMEGAAELAFEGVVEVEL